MLKFRIRPISAVKLGNFVKYTEVNMYIGCHYLLQMSLDPKASAILDDPDRLSQLSLEFCQQAEVRVLHTHFHKFSPQGVTGLILIAESHFTIHTWPEMHYCAIDFFTCKSDLSKQDPTEFFITRLKPTAYKTEKILRDLPLLSVHSKAAQ